MAHHNQQPYGRGGYPQSYDQPAYETYNTYPYGGATSPDPYAQQPYASSNSYPPPPADYQNPYTHYNSSAVPYDNYREAPNEKRGAAAVTYEKSAPGVADSDLALAGAYEAKRREGFTPSNQTRGSVAAQLAAEGTIPEKAGLRMWRSDEHHGAFTRGGRKRCCGRCCCCSIIVIILLTVGIVAAFLLWVRPPNITFNGIEAPPSGPEVNLVTDGFELNFSLNIGVTNPNFFGASFSSITAEAFYPTNKTTALGGGTLDNVDITSHSNTTIHFPFTVNYTSSLDPSRTILTDLATKCGFIGSSPSQITVDYTLILRLKVIAITVSPSFSSSASFACPLTESDIASVLGSSGGSLSGLKGLTGSSRERRLEMIGELNRKRSSTVLDIVEAKVGKREAALRSLEGMIRRKVDEV